MNHKVHHPKGEVPFSWEKKPGVSKEVILNDSSRPEMRKSKSIHDVPFSSEKKHGALKDSSLGHLMDADYSQIKESTLPAHQPNTSECSHDVQLLPLPPGGVMPLQRSASRKAFKKQDDPFLTAYKACTKSCDKGSKGIGGSKDRGGYGISMKMSIFSCKASCSVNDDNMVMIISKNSNSSKSQREKGDRL